MYEQVLRMKSESEMLLAEQVYIYPYIPIHTYIHTYTYTHTFTHTHTHSHSHSHRSRQTRASPNYRRSLERSSASKRRFVDCLRGDSVHMCVLACVCV